MKSFNLQILRAAFAALGLFALPAASAPGGADAEPSLNDVLEPRLKSSGLFDREPEDARVFLQRIAGDWSSFPLGAAPLEEPAKYLSDTCARYPVHIERPDPEMPDFRLTRGNVAHPQHFELRWVKNDEFYLIEDFRDLVDNASGDIYPRGNSPAARDFTVYGAFARDSAKRFYLTFPADDIALFSDAATSDEGLVRPFANQQWLRCPKAGGDPAASAAMMTAAVAMADRARVMVERRKVGDDGSIPEMKLLVGSWLRIDKLDLLEMDFDKSPRTQCRQRHLELKADDSSLPVVVSHIVETAPSPLSQMLGDRDSFEFRYVIDGKIAKVDHSGAFDRVKDNLDVWTAANDKTTEQRTDQSRDFQVEYAKRATEAEHFVALNWLDDDTFVETMVPPLDKYRERPVLWLRCPTDP